MIVIVAAVVSVVGLIVVELVRRAIEKRRAAAGAADDRGVVYEAFIGEALEAIAIAQRVTSLAPRVGFLPANRHLRDSLKALEKTQATIGRLHAHVRRVAPDDVRRPPMRCSMSWRVQGSWCGTSTVEATGGMTSGPRPAMRASRSSVAPEPTLVTQHRCDELLGTAVVR